MAGLLLRRNLKVPAARAWICSYAPHPHHCFSGRVAGHHAAEHDGIAVGAREIDALPVVRDVDQSVFACDCYALCKLARTVVYGTRRQRTIIVVRILIGASSADAASARGGCVLRHAFVLNELLAAVKDALDIELSRSRSHVELKHGDGSPKAARLR